MLTRNWLWRQCSTEGSHLGALQAEVLKVWESLGEEGVEAICYPREYNVITLIIPGVPYVNVPFSYSGCNMSHWFDKLDII